MYKFYQNEQKQLESASIFLFSKKPNDYMKILLQGEGEKVVITRITEHNLCDLAKKLRELVEYIITDQFPYLTRIAVEDIEQIDISLLPSPDTLVMVLNDSNAYYVEDLLEIMNSVKLAGEHHVDNPLTSKLYDNLSNDDFPYHSFLECVSDYEKKSDSLFTKAVEDIRELVRQQMYRLFIV